MGRWVVVVFADWALYGLEARMSHNKRMQIIHFCYVFSLSFSLFPVVYWFHMDNEHRIIIVVQTKPTHDLSFDSTGTLTEVWTASRTRTALLPLLTSSYDNTPYVGDYHWRNTHTHTRTKPTQTTCGLTGRACNTCMILPLVNQPNTSYSQP